MNHLGLFEGIGGFSLAARWAGWNTVAWCEWNDFGQRVLRHHFPEAEGYGDITKVDFRKYEGTIDIITGGFPCQPYSVAGKRRGKEDERHLWPEMLRAIREVQPRYVVGENVSGLINWNGGMVFDEVQSDLEAEGFEVLPFLLPACAKDAPHRRDRVWFIAHSNGCRNDNTKRSERGVWEQSNKEQSGGGGSVQASGFSDERVVTNSSGSGRIQNDKKQQAGQFEQNVPGFGGFPTQPPICDGDDGLSSRLDSITFPKWRSESIKAGGNAIVPQVAYEIFKVINVMEQQIPSESV